MQNNLTKSLGILTKKEKRRLISLSILKIFNGLMDMIGILSIIPFLAFVSNKEKLGNNKYIKISQDYFQFNDNEMLIFLAVISLLILLINYLFKVFTYLRIIADAPANNTQPAMLILPSKY